MTSPDDAARRRRRGTPAAGGRPPAGRDAAASADGDGSAAGERGGLHRLLVESVRDYAIFALDPDGHVLSWNAGARQLKGYVAEEIVGRHFSVFYPPERIAEGFPAYELEVAQRDGRFEDEGWRVRKDGTRFWANVVITALRDEAGTLVGFAKVTRDLTERWRAEEALRASEERFRLLVQSVRDYAIFMLDPQGRVASWNEGAERIKGYRAEEILGRPLDVFYPPEAAASGFPAHELAVAGRVGRFEDEGWRVRKDGTRFWANVVITALRDESGELIGFAKITRDLTTHRAAEAGARRLAAEEAARAEAERRQEELERLATQLQEQALELETQTEEAQSLTEDLEMANEELQGALAAAEEARAVAERAARSAAEANRVKAEFLTAMSHELRTPINATLGYAELLALGIRGPVTEAQREDLARLRATQQHLLGIVNDLLNYGRIEAGQVEYDLAPVPVHSMIEAMLPMIAPQAQAKGLAVAHGPCGERLVALADRAKAEQVVLNLLSNAVKFTPTGGRVTVSCGEADGRVAITVADTGPGVQTAQQGRIFEPFVQLGRSLTSAHEGTGLGLAISRDLARAMGGDVTVASVEGQGATFTFVLPRA
ncbi:MAG: PAS domain-containing sensor histidine kinase [Gemmatimonadaceae bacterium]